MLDLTGLVKVKNIKINDKDIQIPKLSLYHYNMLRDQSNINKSVFQLAQSIHKGLSKAERDLVIIHLLEFNDRLQSSVVVDGFLFELNNIEIIQKLKFEYQEKLYTFRTPTMNEVFNTPEDMLNACCIHVKYKNKKIDIPDFSKMPAFVYKWSEQILTTIGIRGRNGKYIKGIDAVTELFDVRN